MDNPKKSNHSTETFPHLIIHVTDVQYLGDFRLRLTFDNGVVNTVDLWPLIQGRRGVFERIKDRQYFSQVHLDEEAGTIAWPNGVDLAPDVLYYMSNQHEAR